MIKLKNTIELYGRWNDLGDYINRIENHLSVDFSLCLENAKALLETICKEICKEKGVAIEPSISFNSVLKKAFSAIGYTGSDYITQISRAMANIGQQMGNLRNEIGTTSHGKTLDEIRNRNEKVNELTQEFLIDTTVIIACFLIRTFENENPRIDYIEPIEEKLDYAKCKPFNESWDDTFGEFEIGEYSFWASDVLYNCDKTAYINEYYAFKEEE